MSLFRKARQNRIFQDVVEQIEEAIIRGRLKEGERLPSERELQEIFQVSRGTLREALRVLEEKGLLTIKPGVGGGAFVEPVTTRQVSDSLAMLIRYQRVSLGHLAEFREGVEGIVARLAAQRSHLQDIQELQGLLQRAKQCLDEGIRAWEEFLQIDERIHMALARIAGNPIYLFVLQTVHDNIDRYYERFLPREEELMWENYRDLLHIVSAVKQKDPEEAAKRAREHVRRFRMHMEKAKDDQHPRNGEGPSHPP
jgi:DNA-binding FadR family transcriptional regulator